MGGQRTIHLFGENGCVVKDQSEAEPVGKIISDLAKSTPRSDCSLGD